MEWVATTADPNETLDGLNHSTRLLREPPAKLTQRTNKLLQPDDNAEELDALAFKASESDAAEHASARLEAYKSAWQRLSTALQEQQREAMAPLYEALHDYIEHQHETAMSQRRSSSSSCTLGAQRLPAAVVAAAGLNAADYVTTFQDLKEHLKSLDVHAALLSSSDVNQGMAAALAEAFKQLSGLDSGADDVAALTAWYTSTFRAPGPGSTQQQAPASQQQGVAAEAPATAKATGRQLRARAPAAAAPAAGQQAAGGEGPEVAPLPAAPQPLVIMLQGAEQCDVAALRALVLALSQARGSLPVCLLLAVSTSCPLFKQCLPLDLLAALDLAEVKMPPAVARLQVLFQHALLGSSSSGLPPLVLGHSAASHLLRHFQLQDASISTLAAALQLATMLHHQHQPLAALCPHLTSAERPAIKRAVAALPAALLKQGAAALGLAGGARAGRAPSDSETRKLLEEQLWRAAVGYVDWRLALLLLHSLAGSTGALSGERCVYHLPQLYCLASHPAFWCPAAGGAAEPAPNTAQALVSELVTGVGARSLQVLDDERCCAALRALLPLAAAAAASSQRAADLSRQLQQLLDAAQQEQQRGRAAAEEAAEQQQELEQQAEEQEAAAATPLTKLGAKLAAQQQGQQQGSGLTPLGKGLGALGLATPPPSKKSGRRSSPSKGTSPSKGSTSPTGDGDAATAAGSSAAAAAAAAAQQAGSKPAAAAAGSLLSPLRQGFQRLGVAAPKVGRTSNKAERTKAVQAAAAKSQRDAMRKQQGGAAAGGSKAGPAGPSRRSSLDVAGKASSLLAAWLLDSLCKQPFNLPGAAVFCFNGDAQLASLLAPEAPAALHSALAQPATCLPSVSAQPHPSWSDTCIAYHSLQQTPDLLPVNDWFADFCTVYGMVDKPAAAGRRGKGRSKQPQPAAAAANEEPRARTKGRGRRSKAAREAEEAAAAAASAAAAEAEAAEQPPAAALELSEENMCQLAARFCQAVAELQLMGAWRPTKRRKQAVVQRAFFPAVAG